MVILAVDLGSVRTGLAVCDPSETLASPLKVVTGKNKKELLNRVAEAAAAAGAGLIVVGHPKNMDGTAGEKAKESEAFAEKLGRVTGLPVRLWDERLSTVSAHAALSAVNVRGGKRKAVVDAVAAVMILEDFLRFRKNRPEQS